MNDGVVIYKVTTNGVYFSVERKSNWGKWQKLTIYQHDLDSPIPSYGPPDWDNALWCRALFKSEKGAVAYMTEHFGASYNRVHQWRDL